MHVYVLVELTIVEHLQEVSRMTYFQQLRQVTWHQEQSCSASSGPLPNREILSKNELSSNNVFYILLI